MPTKKTKTRNEKRREMMVEMNEHGEKKVLGCCGGFSLWGIPKKSE